MKYEDILYLEHPEPKTRLRMPMSDRAAQFAPFSALTGYGESVNEAARYTEQEIHLTEEEREILNRKLQEIHRDPFAHVSIIHFVPDEKKDGGAYERVVAQIYKIDYYQKKIILADRTEIAVEHILDLEKVD